MDVRSSFLLLRLAGSIDDIGSQETVSFLHCVITNPKGILDINHINYINY